MTKFMGLIPVMFLFVLMGRLSSLPLDINNEIETVINNGIDSEPEYPDQFIDLSAFNSSSFGTPDKNAGEILSNWSPDGDMNPEEMGSYVEGDIFIPNGSGRNGLVAQSSRWPQGIIPFVIQGSFNTFEMDLIKRGIKEYHAKTCLRFKPRKNERDYIAIVNGASGCWSSVGRVGGRQEVNLQTPACLTKVGTFIHEMMHAIGFFHEQNRYDRDGYVTVKYENIVPGTNANFGKTSSNKAHAFGVPYDYGSVMHYSAYAFSKNGNPTIVPSAQGRRKMGQRDGFSGKDLEKINKMYNCHRTYIGSDDDDEEEEDELTSVLGRTRQVRQAGSGGRSGSREGSRGSGGRSGSREGNRGSGGRSGSGERNRGSGGRSGEGNRGSGGRSGSREGSRGSGGRSGSREGNRGSGGRSGSGERNRGSGGRSGSGERNRGSGGRSGSGERNRGSGGRSGSGEGNRGSGQRNSGGRSSEGNIGNIINAIGGMLNDERTN